MSVGSVFDDIKTVAEDVGDFAEEIDTTVDVVTGDVQQTAEDVRRGVEGAEDRIRRDRVTGAATGLFSNPAVAAGAGALVVAVVLSLGR